MPCLFLFPKHPFGDFQTQFVNEEVTVRSDCACASYQVLDLFQMSSNIRTRRSSWTSPSIPLLCKWNSIQQWKRGWIACLLWTMLVCALRSSVHSVADNSIAAITSRALLESDFLNTCFFPCFLAQHLCTQAYALDITYLNSFLLPSCQ